MTKKDIRKKIEKALRRADKELLKVEILNPKDPTKAAAMFTGEIAAYRNTLRWFE
jgi:hypothetical protein